MLAQKLDEVLMTGDWSGAELINSVTRLGDLLDFGQVFKAFGNNQFAQISHILRQFL